MFYIIGSLVVVVILLALCITQEQTLDAERDFWIEWRLLKSKQDEDCFG